MTEPGKMLDPAETNTCYHTTILQSEERMNKTCRRKATDPQTTKLIRICATAVASSIMSKSGESIKLLKLQARILW